MLLFIFSGKLICLLSLSFKRKIYLWTSLWATIMQMIACVFLILAANGTPSFSDSITWTILTTAILFNLLTVAQIAINYRLYPKVARYLYIHITNEMCS